MNQLVLMQNNQAVTTSISVAENFNKRHDNVLRDIEGLRKDVLNFEEMFKIGETQDSYNRPRKTYFMNRDGFTLLAMGFTGKEAIQFKLKYIEAFNKMENHIKQNQIDTSQLSPELQMMNQMFQAMAKNELETKEAKKLALEATQSVSNISNIVAMNNIEWREKVRVILSRIAQNWTGVEPYRSVRNLSYEKLEKRAACNLNIRLNNRKERAIAQGMSKSYVNKISKLDCIAEEKRLVEIYLQVIKEMAIQFRVNINDFQFDEVI